VVDPVAQLINRWCKDDKGRNILYKKNGDERYPEFKLYKMIARHVHHCPPEKEIENTMFNKYISSGGKVKKKRVFNIDKENLELMFANPRLKAAQVSASLNQSPH